MSKEVSNTPSASTTHERVSALYPVGHGDIALLSIDNLLCYVHRHILEHSSPIFGTIFSVRNKGSEDNGPPRLKIEARGSTLETLLAFIYPDRAPPLIESIVVIDQLFRVAKRYEMEGVLHQLRRCLLEVRVAGDTVTTPLFVKHPLAVLVISYVFECPEEGRLALRECLRGDINDHVAGAKGFDIPSELMSAVLTYRRERSEWFLTELDTVGWPANNCINCYKAVAEKRTKSAHLIANRSNTDVYTEIWNKLGQCNSGHIISLPNLESWTTGWAEKAKRLEESLPQFPHLPRYT